MGRKKVSKVELIPDPVILINGLRDTGYDFNTAVADIIDNSVDADASKIDIRLRLVPNTRYPVSLMIADNGCGMDREGLLNGMMYGSKSTDKDPKRLGKFGLGLKTASTAFSRKLSLISKAKSSDTFIMATWDLDQVARMNKWEIEVTEEKDIPKDYLSTIEDIATDGHGTLVVWDKVDRLGIEKLKQMNNTISSLTNHLSMIFNRFLDHSYTEAKDIDMTINGSSITAWDPFCRNEKETVINGETGKEASVILENGEEHTAPFQLCAYTLPDKDSYSSEEAKKNARLTNYNMGFYVYRENRMISYGDWLGLRAKDPHESLSRIEFSFNHELDAAFRIDVKKSQISLNPDLANWLGNWIAPHVKFAEQRYRKKQIESTTKDVTQIHMKPDNLITEQEKSNISSRITPVTPVDPETRIQTVAIENGKTQDSGPLHVQIIVPEDSQLGINIFPVKSLPDGVLWAPTYKNNHHAVLINTSHPFYQKVYCPNHQNGIVMDGLDDLLWALAEAENSVKYNQEQHQNYEDLRIDVSIKLKRLVADLPDPQ
jgi:hypothetical protein